MVIIWLLLILLLGLFLLAFTAILRMRMPLEPNLSPGDLSEARDPEYFVHQEEIFREHGYRPVGDFFWHEGLTSVAMRVFLAEDGRGYGWVLEQALAGDDHPRYGVSVMSLFPDGTVLDTTSATQGTLIDPPWFRREKVAGDTRSLLRRHRERQEEMHLRGKEPLAIEEKELLATIRRQERRLGEYQVEKGRMKIVDGKLAYTSRGAFHLLWKVLGRLLPGAARNR
ncbi:MAG: hypothetical protein GX493_00355 [Firmicutes bacterium]|nr:hypothetical protein [Bacillota bacterium]